MEKKLSLNGYKCSMLVNKMLGVPLIFLHGLSYTIGIWQRLGVTELLDEKHVPYIALDMPYGEKSRCEPKTCDVEKNVSFVYNVIENVFGSFVSPVLVGASIGGYMALHFAARFPVKGLFLVGPAQVFGEQLVQSYANFRFPSTIIWGSADSIIASEDMRTLADKLPNSKLIIYHGAKHSAYKDYPERFKHDLLELYIKAEA